jgi:hypothetical protein
VVREYRLVDDRFTTSPSSYCPGGITNTKVRRGDVRLETLRESWCRHCVTVGPKRDLKRMHINGCRYKRKRDVENTQSYGRIGLWVLCKMRKHCESRVRCNEKLDSLYSGSKKNIKEKIISFYVGVDCSDTIE